MSHITEKLTEFVFEELSPSEISEAKMHLNECAGCREDLARFQRTLLDLLSQGQAPQNIIAQLQRDPELAEFAAYLASFEPRMVEVAVELVAKWGRREGGIPK
jgi:hypothetical protein